MRNKRSMKVYRALVQKEDIPQIRLQGEWLKELGYRIGDKITVEQVMGMLVIRKEE